MYAMKWIRSVMVIGAGLLIACQPTPRETIMFDPEIVPVYRCLERDSLPVDGIGALFIVLSSDYLVTVHFTEDYFFKVYSKKDFSWRGNVLNRGRGPNELLDVGYINQWKEENGHLKILANQLNGNYAWIDIDRALEGKDSIVRYEELKFQEAPERLRMDISMVNYFGEDSLLLYFVPQKTENRPECRVPYYVFYHPDAATFTEPFPLAVIDGKNDALFSSIYTSVMAFSPDMGHLASAICGLRTIQILDFKKQKSTEVKFPDSPRRMEKTEVKDLVFGFAGATQRFAWISEAKGITDVESHRIFLVDWEGNPCGILELDCNILSFFPDESEKVLYVVDREDGVFRYDLRDFYDRILPGWGKQAFN